MAYLVYPEDSCNLKEKVEYSTCSQNCKLGNFQMFEQVCLSIASPPNAPCGMCIAKSMIKIFIINLDLNCKINQIIQIKLFGYISYSKRWL